MFLILKTFVVAFRKVNEIIIIFNVFAFSLDSCFILILVGSEHQTNE